MNCLAVFRSKSGGRVAHLEDALLLVPERVRLRARRDLDDRLPALQRALRDVLGKRKNLLLRRDVALLHARGRSAAAALFSRLLCHGSFPSRA
jgi:hypothetical protein